MNNSVSHDSFRFGQPAIELIGECLTLSRSEEDAPIARNA